MKTVQSRKLLRTLFFMGLLLPALVVAQETSFVYGDALPDAPELSARGSYKVGVRTLEFVNKGQVDILNSKEGNDPLYDRSLTPKVDTCVKNIAISR